MVALGILRQFQYRFIEMINLEMDINKNYVTPVSRLQVPCGDLVLESLHLYLS